MINGSLRPRLSLRASSARKTMPRSSLRVLAIACELTCGSRALRLLSRPKCLPKCCRTARLMSTSGSARFGWRRRLHPDFCSEDICSSVSSCSELCRSLDNGRAVGRVIADRCSGRSLARWPLKIGRLRHFSGLHDPSRQIVRASSERNRQMPSDPLGALDLSAVLLCVPGAALGCHC